MSSDDSVRARFDRLIAAADRLPLAPGFFGGVGAFAGGFTLFVAAVTASGNPTFANPIRTLKELGTLFYNAQNVALIRHREVTLGDQHIVEEATVNLLQQSDPSLPHLVYYLVPVVAIATVALILADRYIDPERPGATLGGLAGGVTLGYVLAALVGSVLVGQRTSQEEAFETLSPAGLEVLAYGIAYPLVVTTVVAGLVLGLYGWGRNREQRERPQA